MAQVSAERVAAVHDWVKQSRDDFSLQRVAGFAEVMTAAMSDAVGVVDRTLVTDFDALAREIALVRREIAAASPVAVPQHGLPEAGKELEEVVAATEEASNAIMSACEAILGADPDDVAAYQNLVAEHITAIFEACSFQDLAGQRITKVLKVLRAADERLVALTDRLREVDPAADRVLEGPQLGEDLRNRALLLFGPQARACAQSQDDIDRLFSEVVSQDEIDQLFD